MAGNFDNAQVMKVEGAIMQVRDQLALISQGIQTQNQILNRLLDEQNSLIQNISNEIANK
jgi:hypothetical protein